MVTFLVIYGTGEGQTAKIASRIVDRLRERGHEASATRAAELEPGADLAGVDAVVVGASIHYGAHQEAVREFVESHREALAAKPTAFFQVSLTSADESGEAKAAGYVEEFVEATGWHPDRVGLFGGALRYSEYGFLRRLMMKRIAKQHFPEAPSGEETEFTDWNEVDAFAADVAGFVESRLGIVPPGAVESDPGDAGDDG